MTPKERELLTLAIDGELSATEARQARRLVQNSPEAKAFYLALKKDSALLRRLKTTNCPVDLSASVIKQITDNSITPIPAPPTHKRRPRVWYPLALAASVLLFITGVSTLIFDQSRTKEAGQGEAILAKNSITTSRSSTKPIRTTHDLSIPEDIVKLLPPTDAHPTIPERGVVVDQPTQPLAVEVLAIQPRELKDHPLTSPIGPEIPDIIPVGLDRLKLTKFFEASQLLKDSERAKLLEEIKRDKIVRLDLFAHSTTKGLDLLQNVLKSQGVSLMMDSFAQDRLKKNQATDILIYTESLTAEQIHNLILNMVKVDSQNSITNLDTLVIAPFQKVDLDKLCQSLGVSSSQLNLQPTKGGTKPSTPLGLEQGTANSIAHALSKSPSNKAEPVAIGVSYSPLNLNARSSKEIAVYFDKRGERKADHPPLMLVIRATP
ncbi:MAG: hypothetical protein N2112_07065 [Gemmataceae bacterium]|jgi:hypothetical protein|nr:hypothetical protein [Gemmataceae bacterium]